MEHFLLSLPSWLILVLYALALGQTLLAARRFMAHWGLLCLQAGVVLVYAFGSADSPGLDLPTFALMRYLLLLQALSVVIAVYGLYHWYRVSYRNWQHQYEKIAHILDNPLEGKAYRPAPVSGLSFAHHVAMTFVVIVLWLFLARMYTFDLTQRAGNQGWVGVMAFVLTLNYIGNFLLAHFYIEAWAFRFLSRLLELLFFAYRGALSPAAGILLGLLLLANLWAWRVWRINRTKPSTGR